MKSTRWTPVVTVPLLILGWTSTAFRAALHCSANAAVPPTLRAEGLTEFVGDLVLTCTGGTPIAAGVALPKLNIAVFFSTGVTSRVLVSPWSEALMLID